MTYPELMGAMGKNGRLAVGAGYYNPKTTYLNPADMSGVPYEVYSYATCIIEVEVDTDTGEVQLLKCVSAHDVGTPVGVKMCEGQIEGGTAMGTGFVISEKIEIDPKTCAIKNPSLSKYIIESSMDVPEVYPIVVCSDGDAAPYGAKGHRRAGAHPEHPRDDGRHRQRARRQVLSHPRPRRRHCEGVEGQAGSGGCRQLRLKVHP